MAEEEAAAIRAAVIADTESRQRSAEEAPERCTNEVDTYAEKRRSAAEAEAAGIIQRAAERRQEVEAPMKRSGPRRHRQLPTSR